MKHRVRVRQAPTPLSVSEDQTILEAALAAGVAYPHGCRAGRCGSCRSRLVRGNVVLDRHTPFALSEADKAAGLILACRARPTDDVEVAWLEDDATPEHPSRKIAARVIERIPATHDIVRLRLSVEGAEPLAFSAGQFASLSFGHLPPRDYSMANRPDDPVLEFHIRRMPYGSVSRHVFDAVAVGDVVGIEGPFGTAHLRQGHAGPIVAIAGGSGLAPIASIVATALDAGMRQPIHLYVGARSEHDLYLVEHFERLAALHPNLVFVPVLSSPVEATSRRVGWVHEAAAADFPSLAGAKLYTAGPPALVDAAVAMGIARGLRHEDIHADPFTGQAERTALAG